MIYSKYMLKNMRTLSEEILDKLNEEIELAGWVDVRRDHGKIIFIDLRDRSGIVQLVFVPKENPEVYKLADTLRQEWVIKVKGKVSERPKGMINDNLKTGKLEIQVTELEIITKAKTPPFALDTDGYEVSEELRMQYRYLDMRRRRLTKNLRNRHKVIKFMRDFLTERGFVEVETPNLGKSTPEGARDYLVPSRIYPGNFYALPQSPQQYKQLLMVGGLERYFQIARCFRDEDTRGDRQPEFTQLDVEMSFITQEDILNLTEELFSSLVKELFPHKIISKSPWPRLSHSEARKKFGTDKPDLREDKGNPNELAFSWTIDFPLFNKQIKEDFFHGSGSAKFAPSHHMFTAPHPDDLHFLDADPLKARGLQHDLVLNGYEIGGGSIRIHQPEVQRKIFDLIGFSDEQKQQFNHMLTAFEYGVPPHGGIAPGIDRFMMILENEPNIREVIAFPKTGDGRDLLMGAPSEVSNEQLKELHIEISKTQKDNG